ncbi:HD domain-containing protein [Kordia sp.]|uniref:HD domain-containing protein n=1 Tax=Kordia sp. TaxID=1965332 RepID=UPI003D6BF2E3
MENELYQSWLILTSKYTDDELLLNQLWKEINQNYTTKKRHYHNLNHIKYMLQLASNDQVDLNDSDTLQFAIWYHDIIYNATKSNNELKSAEFAQKRLKKLQIDSKKIENCANLIISTKKHEILNAQNQDNAYLLDWDLAILGTTWKSYHTYTQNIRKEYSMFPDFMYKKGRKKVLQHFLERPRIYYTEKYHNLWETIARENIQKELTLV